MRINSSEGQRTLDTECLYFQVVTHLYEARSDHKVTIEKMNQKITIIMVLIIAIFCIVPEGTFTYPGALAPRDPVDPP